MKRIIIAAFLVWGANAVAQQISPSGGGGGSPTGAAGGDLGGTYPNPTIFVGQNAILTAPGAANLQFGAVNVNGAPIAQKLSFQGALAGSATNQVSANTTIVGSLGTGTGTNGDIIFQTGIKTSTGTVQATATTAATIKGETLSFIQPALAAIQAGDGAVSPTIGTPGMTFSGATGIGFRRSNTNLIVFTAAGADIWSSGASSLNMRSNGVFGWSSTTDPAAGDDVILSRGGVATIQHGTGDAASPVPQSIRMQSVVAGTSNTAGADATTIGSLSTGTGVGGKLIYKVALTGTTGTAQNNAFPMFTIIPGAATTASVQFGDGTNFTTYDSCTALTTSATGVVQCTASAMRFKNALGSVQPEMASLDALHPAVWSYKLEYQQRFGEGVHVGLYADDVAKMDQRCAVYEDGLVKNYEDRCVIAHMVAEMQAMKAEIYELKRKR